MLTHKIDMDGPLCIVQQSKWLLYAYNANITTSERNLDTVLILATNHNANLSARTKDFATPLHYLAKVIPENDIEQKKLRQILSRFQSSNINATTSNGDTPLHRAVFARNVFVTRFLLENNATPDAKDGFGLTPLYYAVDERDKVACVDIVKLLLVYEADPTVQSKHGSPMDQAVSGFNPDILKLMQEYKDGTLETISQLQRRHNNHLRRNSHSFVPAVPSQPCNAFIDVLPTERNILDVSNLYIDSIS